jgi:hypothetical protein
MRWRSVMAPLAVALLVASCAHQPPPAAGAALPGFLLGLLHGYISLFSLIASLFTDVRIYAYPNSGGWYDFGFVVGVLAFYGSGSHTYSYSSSRWR